MNVVDDGVVQCDQATVHPAVFAGSRKVALVQVQTVAFAETMEPHWFTRTVLCKRIGSVRF